MNVATIALLTDFGTRDPFVGVMKGVIASIAPRATVIDLGHEIAPQDVRAASIALWTSHAFFPRGTVFVCVVDPGVGTTRRALAARAHGKIFLAPDNGLLTPMLDDDRRAVVRTVERRAWMLPHLSATFHGRDVFAPVGARLARGASFARVGSLARRLERLELPEPVRRGRVVEGEVLDVDRFGNARTNVPARWATIGAVVLVRGRSIARVARTYGDVAEGRSVAMIGSAGLLEIAVRGGSAASRFRLSPGTRIRLEFP